MSEETSLLDILRRMLLKFERDESPGVSAVADFDPASPDVYFLVVKWYWTSENLAQQLTEMYVSARTSAPDVGSSTSRKWAVARAFRYWQLNFPEDFALLPELRAKLASLQQMMKEDGETDLLEYISQDSLPEESWNLGGSGLPNGQLRRPSNSLSFDSCSAEDIAVMLCAIDYKLFRRVPFCEFCIYAHTAKPTKDTLRIDECIQFFNGVTNWVVCNILREITMAKRGEIIEKFIEATKHLYNLHSYNTMLAVLGGLNHFSVRRLQQTWNIVDKSKKEDLNTWTNFFNSHMNYSAYRHAVTQLDGAFCIPVIGIALKDMVAVDTQSRDFTNSGTQAINMVKYRKLWSILSGTRRHQLTAPTIQPRLNYGIAYLSNLSHPRMLAAKKLEIDGEQELLHAAQRGDVGEVKRLIESGVSVNSQDGGDYTPLHLAANGGHTTCVEHLLSTPGIDVNIKNEYGRTPLHLAAREGRTSCVEHLLSTPGIDVNIQDRGCRTPLHLAAWKGHTTCVEHLLSTPSINVNIKNKHGDAPLHLAARGGHTTCVEHLLSTPGIDVNIKDRDGETLLHLAAKDGHTTCVEHLLSTPGIDVNIKDRCGLTPLHFAAREGHTTCVEHLLSTPGIDVNIKSRGGYTPLHLAASGGHTTCVEHLLSTPGIDVNIKSRYGRTPLHWAAQGGHTTCVERLLSTPGIDVNIKDEDGHTPLHLAARGGHTACVEHLLSTPGSNVNIQSELHYRYGRTPLHLAAIGGHTTCVERLLSTPGIDLDIAFSSQFI